MSGSGGIFLSNYDKKALSKISVIVKVNQQTANHICFSGDEGQNVKHTIDFIELGISLETRITDIVRRGSQMPFHD